jgi:copper chaperone CopZ
MKYDLKIGGMSCHHCVKAVTEALEGVKDLTVESVTMGAATVIASNQAALDAAREAVEEEGYPVEEAVGS